MAGAHCSPDSGKSILHLLETRAQPGKSQPGSWRPRVLILARDEAQLRPPTFLPFVDAGPTLDLEAFPPVVPTMNLYRGKDSDEGC